MAAKDKYHEHVKEALIKDGWEITHDPYVIVLSETEKIKIDLGAQKILAAQKGSKKIAVEVKSFLSESPIYEYHGALGQIINYQIGINKIKDDRMLFLAMPDEAFEVLSTKIIFRESIKINKLNIILFNVENKSIVSWKK